MSLAISEYHFYTGDVCPFRHDAEQFFYNFFRVLMIGIISSFISFFLIDDFVREKLVPILFPEGQLSAIPGAVRISILRRIRVLFGVGTNAPMILLCVTIAFAIWELDETVVTTAQFSREHSDFFRARFLLFSSSCHSA